MIKRRVKKLVAVFLVSAMVLPLVLSLFFSDSVNASNLNTNTSGGNSANATARSMIDFFKTQNQLNHNRLSQDEIKVWGVFLSNFFIPYHTTLSDLVKEPGSDGTVLVEKLSTKFFGNTNNQTQAFLNLNKELYNSILNGLESSSRNFALFGSAEAAAANATPLSGEEFIQKLMTAHLIRIGAPTDTEVKSNQTIAGKDAFLYMNRNGVATPVLNLNDKATKAAIQVLMSLSPEMFLSKDKGLRGMESLHMDGVGNIWGRKIGETNYRNSVLFFPAALNPIVFGGNAQLGNNSLKLPMANSFVMGGLLKVAPADIANSPNKFLPYYNVPSMYMQSSKHIVSFMGVYSVTPRLGNSDSIFAGTGNIPLSDILSFIDRHQTDPLELAKAKVLMTVRMENSPFLLDTAFESGRSNQNLGDYTSEASGALASYLSGSDVFSMTEIADDLYYFNNPWTMDTSIGDLDLATEGSLFTKQRLFTKGIFDASNGKYSDTEFSFYAGSSAFSPFANLLSRYHGTTTESEREQFLSATFNAAGYSYSALPDGVNKGDYMKENLSKKDVRDFLDYLTFSSRFYGNPTDNPDDGTATDYSSPNRTLKVGTSPHVNANLNTALRQATKFFSQKDVDLISSSFIPVEDTAFKFDNGNRAWWTAILRYLRYTPVSSAFSGGDSILQDLSASGSKVSSSWDGRLDGVYFGRGGYSGFDGFMTYRYDDTGNIPVGAPENPIRSLISQFMVYNVFGIQSNLQNVLDGDGFTNPAKYDTLWGSGDDAMTLRNPIANEVNNFIGMYWGYVISLMGADEETPDALLSFSNQYLPFMTINVTGGSFSLGDLFASAGATADSNATDEMIARDLLRKLYSFMSDGGSDYRDRLIKSTQDSWIISTHHSIVGSWVGKDFSVSAGGNSSYGSIVGFINTPSLLDLPLTAWLLSDYLTVYIFIMVLTLILVVLMVVTSLRTIRDGIATLIVMAFLLLLPQFLLTNVINITNTVSDKIFSDRFNYWAIVQHEQSLRGIKAAASSGDAVEYLIALNADAMQNAHSQGSGVTLRWMAPKRHELFESMLKTQNLSQQLSSNLSIFRWLFANYMTQDSYVSDDPMATYIYRPYNTIVQEASANYSRMKDATFSKSGVLSQIENRVAGFTGIPDHRFAKFFGTPPLELPPETLSRVKAAAPVNIGGTDAQREEIEAYRYWWLSSEGINNAIFNSDIDGVVGYSGSLDHPSVKAFTLITESPFYYFYTALASRSVSGKFKNDLLNESIFKVKGSSGESYNNQLRDFLDLEGLFTYVIPYLSQSNDYVYRYTDKYGMNAKDLSRVTPPELPSKDDDDYEKKLAIYNDYQLHVEHRDNLKAVWVLYSPWVDQLYSTSFSSGNYRTLGKSTFLSDTLNPASYELSGRPMIFSPADMRAKNATQDALSDVEYRMQNVLKKTYTDMMYLVNYYDFSDEVLLAAAAMSATFNFNIEFSEKKLLGESSMQYPQGYELKNFNYDAFLRLILLNSTGEPMMADEDLYARIIKKTSFITGCILLVSDILNVIVVPAMKMVVLFLLFIMIFVMVLNGMLTPPDKILNFLWKKIFSPVLWFIFVTLSFSVLISIVMGEGLTGYVGSRSPGLGMTDPTVTLLLLVLFSLLYIFFLAYLSFKFFKTIRDEGTALFGATVGMVASAGSGLLGKAAKVSGLKMLLGGKGGSVVNNIQNYGTTEKKKTLLSRVSNKLKRGKGGYGGSDSSAPPQGGGSDETTKKIDELAETNNQAQAPVDTQSSAPDPKSPAYVPDDSSRKFHQAKVHYRKDGSIDVQMKVYTPEEISALREKKKAEKEAAKEAKVSKGNSIGRGSGSAGANVKSRKRKPRKKK